MKKKIKDNKIILIIIVSLVVLSIILVKLLDNYSNEKGAIYGSRLDGIEKVKVTSNMKTEIINNIKSMGKTKKASVAVQGKIINCEITVNDDITRDDAKTIADRIPEKLTEEQKKFYDIQIFIKKNTDDQTFPIIGYHHHNRETFTWTLDR